MRTILTAAAAVLVALAAACTQQEQPAAEVKADEAGGAGHENPHT